MGKDADFINTCYPVTGITKYKNGCYKIKRTSLLQGNYTPEKRGKIKMLTKKSLLNLIWTINATGANFNSMLTLTYPDAFPVNGATIKDDLRVYLQWFTRRYNTQYLWFLEFQERGAPHFHILTETSEITPTMRVDAGIRWTRQVIDAKWFMSCFGVVGAGDYELDFDYQGYRTEALKVAKFNVHETVWQLAKSKNGMRNYAAKYASKEYQKEVPKKFTEVGRFWGASSGIKPVAIAELDATEDDVREWLRKLEHGASEMDVLPKLIFNAKQKVDK